MSEGKDEKKMGLKDFNEAVDAATGVVEDLAEHRSDDGKISVLEAGQTLVENSSALVRAVMGAENIDDELKDIDAEEAKVVAAKSFKLVKAVMKLIKAEPKQ